MAAPSPRLGERLPSFLRVAEAVVSQGKHGPVQDLAGPPVILLERPATTADRLIVVPVAVMGGPEDVERAPGPGHRIRGPAVRGPLRRPDGEVMVVQRVGRQDGGAIGKVERGHVVAEVTAIEGLAAEPPIAVVIAGHDQEAGLSEPVVGPGPGLGELSRDERRPVPHGRAVPTGGSAIPGAGDRADGHGPPGRRPHPTRPRRTRSHHGPRCPPSPPGPGPGNSRRRPDRIGPIPRESGRVRPRAGDHPCRAGRPCRGRRRPRPTGPARRGNGPGPANTGLPRGGASARCHNRRSPCRGASADRASGPGRPDTADPRPGRSPRCSPWPRGRASRP